MTALVMALGLTLPAITLAQDSDPKPDQRPPRRQRVAQRDATGGDQAGPGPQRDGAPGAVDRAPLNHDGGPDGQRPRMIPPLMAALDTNHDGVLDEDEIKNAAESLRKLDKNGDGKITADELRPQRPDGAGPGAGPGQREDGREGVGPGGNRDAAPADGQRPPRRNARPPQGE